MEIKHALTDYYVQYLKKIRNLSDSSVEHYQDALKFISKYLVKKGKLNDSIYEIQNVNELEDIRAFLEMQDDFASINKQGHQMYSAGLNNYIRFAKGDEFADIHERIRVLDFVIPAPTKQKVIVETWSRSNIIKTQAIEYAEYKCEFDDTHKTFESKSTGRQYMEGHHALPMKFQDMFSNSLDVYANIVCLCPNCHRLLHYGTSSDKKCVVDKIYYERADRLADSGIIISKEDFEKLVI